MSREPGAAAAVECGPRSRAGDEPPGLDAAFRATFGRPVPAFASLPRGLFTGPAELSRFLRKTVHFAHAVIEPLRDHGLDPRDRIVDVASGNGEMAAALALLGFERVTLWDLDASRLEMARRRADALGPDRPEWEHRCENALGLAGEFDVVTCCQTLEHLSDSGNYAVASRSCQVEFMRRLRACRPRLVYFNVPNWTYPFDGHDTGLFGFHYLPMRFRRALIESGLVKCSWSGIARPVSLAFFRRHLPEYRLVSRYHAFASFDDYVRRRPPFGYMGEAVPAESPDRLRWQRRLVRLAANGLGSGAQLFLPSLSVVYARR